MNVTVLLAAALLAYGPWESTGPEGGQVKALLQSGQDPGVLFALSGSSPSQVVRSQDGGSSWETISEIQYCNPYDMVMTADGRLVVLGSSRTWTSADGGYTWSDTYISNTIFYNGAAHPTEGGTVYAAGYKYDGSSWNMSFFSSTDCGDSWTDVPLVVSPNTSYGRCVAVSGSNPDHILVGGYEYQSGYSPYLFKSEDGGTSFLEVTPAAANYYFSGAAFHPSNPDIILAGDLTVVFRSTDGGSTWSNAGSLTYSYDISFSDADHDLVMSAGLNRTYRSTDAGQTWSTVTAGLSGDGINWIVPDAVSTSTAYTGSSAGFFHSDDGGQSWTPQNSGLVLGRALAMEYVNGWVFMNMQDMGLWKGEDGPSITWEQVTTPLTCGDFCALESVGPDTLLALEGGG